MASLQIPEHLEDELEIAAEASGRTKEEVAAEILEAHFLDVSLPLSAFTDEQLTRLKHSMEQIKRGEFITAEQVDRKFEAWFAKRAAR
jgi:predicted transcriptional regulator